MSKLQEKMQKNIVQISLVTRSCPQKMGINEKYLGFEGTNEETRDFIKKQLESSIRFFPKEQFDRTQRVTKRLNQLIRRQALAKGVNGYFLDISKYATIKKEYLKTKQEYDDVKQLILDNHETSLKLFKENVKQFLIERKADISLLDSIINRFPDKSEIENSFVCSLEIQPYPVFDNSLNCKDPSLITDTIKKHENDSVKLYQNIVTTLLAQSCELICSILDKLEKDEPLPSKTKARVSSFMNKLKKSNDWLKSSELGNLENYLNRVLVSCQSLFKNEYGEFDTLGTEEHLEQLEYIISYIFNCSEKMNTHEALPLDENYDKDSLRLMYQLNPLTKTFDV